MVIKSNDDKSTIIKDVLFVPGMGYNILSISQLIEKCFYIFMKNDVFKLYDPTTILVFRSPLAKNRTFKTLINTTEVECLKVIVKGKKI